MTPINTTTYNMAKRILSTMLSLAFIFTVLLSKTSITQAQYYPETQKILAADSSAGDGFGWSVEVSGIFAVAGMPSDNDNGDKSGSACIMKYNGFEWETVSKISASDAKAYEMFGREVAINGNTVVVTAPGDHDLSKTPGSIYIFTRMGSDIVETARITSPENKLDDHFGRSVAIDRNTIVVGATGTDGDGEHSGSAYVYYKKNEQWYEETKLVASDAGTGDHLGFSSAVYNDVIVVGAPFHNVEDNNNGAAYVFRYDYDKGTWIEEAKLIASDRTAQSFFGTSCSINKDTIVIGAYRDAAQGTDSGAAYVFRYDNTDGQAAWVEEAKLVASDGGEYDNFGRTVKIDDNMVLVGADYAYNSSVSTGAVYVYRYNSYQWIETDKLAASDRDDQDRFGKNIGYDQGILFVGTPYDDDYYQDSGSVYIYDLNNPLKKTLILSERHSRAGGNPAITRAIGLPPARE